MVCPYCANDTQVTNSRHQKRTNSVWRRRHCPNCGIVFTTHEKADLATSTVVMKQPNILEPLERDELFISVYESCKHRLTAQRDATALTDTIIGKIVKQQSADGVITMQDLLQITTEVLQYFDPVSGTYYRAYYGKNG